MTTFSITSSNSVATTNGSPAFSQTSPGGTLSVSGNGYLIALNGGDGADITDFTSVTVGGIIQAYGTTYDGLSSALATTTSPLRLTVDTAGKITGGYDGFYSTQVDTITNAGTIQGNDDAGINELNNGSNSLTNAASAIVIGYDYGLYMYGSSGHVTQTVNNYGLIQGTNDYGIYLEYGGASSVYNGSPPNSVIGQTTNGQIIGGDYGVYVYYGSGSQTVTNATGGFIDGYDGAGIYFEDVAGAMNISNAAKASITGYDGIDIENSSGAITITNSGLINGVDDNGIYLYNNNGAVTITNSATGQIVGNDDYAGIYSYESVGALTITNAGLINGYSDGGIYVEYNSSPAALAITNASSGHVTGYDYGIYVYDWSGTVSITNSGLLYGEYDAGVYLESTGSATITNATTGVIKGEDYGIYYDASGGLTVNNSGLVNGLYDYGIEVYAGGNVTITNASTGTISGETGIYDDSSTATHVISNQGSIIGTAGDGIDEYTSGLFTLTNSLKAQITGTTNGVYDDGSSGARTITNAGYIQGAAGYGIFEDTTGATAIITNSAGGHIIGGGATGYGIYDEVTGSATQTISNAGVITGTVDAVWAANGAPVVFSNSGTVNGSIVLGGTDTVTISTGMVSGSIDMTSSSGTNAYNMSGGSVTGPVLFGSGNTTANLSGGAGTAFDIGAGTATFVFQSTAASNTTKYDTVTNFVSGGSDFINVHKLGTFTFSSVHQDTVTSPGNDLITITGSTFELKLAGITNVVAHDFIF